LLRELRAPRGDRARACGLSALSDRARDRFDRWPTAIAAVGPRQAAITSAAGSQR
jgi:hypothetical protein